MKYISAVDVLEAAMDPGSTRREKSNEQGKKKRKKREHNRI